MPKLSIIVPVYNVEKYLKVCIDSILKQSYTQFELILVDDGSSDESGNICDDYAKLDKRIVVIHQTNKGVSTARNVGIKHSKGEYISFVDADDFIAPQMYEKMVAILENEKDVDVVACGISRYTEKNGNEKSVLEFSGLSESGSRDKEYYSNENLIIDLFARPSVIERLLFNKVYRRECMQGIEFLTHLKILEDFRFLLEIYVNGSCEKCVRLQDVFYYYRINENSATHGKGSFDFHKTQFKRDIFQYVHDNAPKYEKDAILLFLDFSIFHIRKYRETGKVKEYQKDIWDVKLNMLYWIMYGKKYGLLNKKMQHRYLYEGVIRA